MTVTPRRLPYDDMYPGRRSDTSIRASPGSHELGDVANHCQTEKQDPRQHVEDHPSLPSVTGTAASGARRVAAPSRDSHVADHQPAPIVPDPLRPGSRSGRVTGSSRISPEIGSSPGLARIATTYVQPPAGRSDAALDAQQTRGMKAGPDSSHSSVAAIAERGFTEKSVGVVRPQAPVRGPCA